MTAQLKRRTSAMKPKPKALCDYCGKQSFVNADGCFSLHRHSRTGAACRGAHLPVHLAGPGNLLPGDVFSLPGEDVRHLVAGTPSCRRDEPVWDVPCAGGEVLPLRGDVRLRLLRRGGA